MSNPNVPTLKRDSQNNACQESYINDMAFQGQYTGTNLTYRGYARPGSLTADPVWQISFLTYDGNDNVTSITWPQVPTGGASSGFTFVWDDRASYTYS